MERKQIGTISFVGKEIKFEFVLRLHLPITAIQTKNGWESWDSEVWVYELRGTDDGAKR